MLLISPNNEYPRFIGDLKIAHPNYRDGDSLPEGWIEVIAQEMPSATVDEVIYEDFPIEKNGKFIQNWKVRPMNAAELERRDAPQRAKEKLIALGLTEVEIQALVLGMVR